MNSSIRFQLCNTEFWNLESTWNTNKPRLSECFRDTVLAWIPAGILLYVCAYEYFTLGRLKSLKREPIPRNWFNRLRLGVAFLLFLVRLCGVASYLNINLGRSSRGYNSETGVVVNQNDDNILFVSSLLAPVVQSICFLILVVVYHFQRKAGRHTSGPVWFYLVASFLCASADFYSIVSSPSTPSPNQLEQVLDYIYFGLVALLFLLECYGDKPVVADDLINTQPISPEIKASFLSQITFWWYNRFLLFGYRHELSTAILWRTLDRDRSSLLVPKFRNSWLNFSRKETNEKDVYKSISGQVQKFNSVLRVFIRLFWPKFLLTAVLKFLQDLLQFSTPMVLKLLLGFMTDDKAPHWHGLLFALTLLLMPTVQSLILGNYFYNLQVMGINIKSMIIGTIYRKALSLSAGSRLQSTTGEIVNLMAVDSQRFQDVLMYIHLFWSAPFQITLAVTLLYRELGWPALAGVAILVLLIPLVAYLATLTKESQTKLIKTKDQRIKQTNEVLSGIKVIKLYAWENSFMSNLLNFRENEVKHLRRILDMNAVQNFLWNCSPFVVAVITFGVYVSVDKANVLNAQKAFVSISLFNLLSFPLLIVSTLVQNMVLTAVSARRLNRFLNSDEMVDYVTRNEELEAIAIEGGTCNWVENSDEKLDSGATLKEINLHVKPGSFVAVVGQVASGKSSLLASMLGEMYRVAGRFNICKSMQLAYVPQQAWIQNMTVRNNILFGAAFDEERYRQVLSVCSLEADLEMLPAGDQSEIGEKGINLSGGQKQRVSLARACYSNADIFLLDDPLSALDSHVAKQVFEKVLSSQVGLLRRKTRVLATNSLFVLPYVDQVLVMENGRVVESGSYKELMRKGGQLAEVMRQYTGKQEKEEEIAVESATRQQAEPATEEHISKTPDQVAKSSEGKLIELEKVETGSVSFKVYLRYFKAVSTFWLSFAVLSLIASSVFNVSTNFWLSSWSTDAQDEKKRQDPDLRTLRLTVYASLGAFQCVAILMGTFAHSRGAVRASKQLYRGLLDRVMRLPMSFFDVTPNGRIVNRFAKDIDVVDSNLPDNFRSWLTCSLQVSSTVFVVCYSFPTFLAVVVPLAVIYYLIQRVFIVTTRQLKRLESNTRSPIYSHFGETLSGLSTIRAYDCVDRFVGYSDKLVDRNLSCSYPNIIANRWLSLRLEFFGNLVTACAALFSVYHKGQVDAGVAGLVVSYSMSITQILNWFVRMNSELETNIVSVERILEYMSVKEEDRWLKDNRPPAEWPSKGEIKIENYSTRYRPEMDLVLKDLSLSIKPCEKVGVVGRTGSGKSSLSLSLFRILEPAGGRITIDELDVIDYGLHDLRSKLTIIPQDPVLFSGTIRFNLDPLKLYSDLDIWRALDLAHLKVYVSSLKSGLDYQVSEFGENFSMGQRQLICLGRAILRQSKILILDEATASVDLETDNIVQRVIRDVFSNCTIITIAHRLHTILDSDRILVLDRGSILELDSPKKLLSDPNSAFSALARDAGVDLDNFPNSA